METIKSEKMQRRIQMREILSQITPLQREKWSEAITDKITELPEFSEAEVIMLFLSMSTEYDTGKLIQIAVSKGKTVCAPKVDWARWTMSAVKLKNSEDCFIDERNLCQPAGSEVIAAQMIDFVLVPGLAFDRRGKRLGRGGGFYDRFLSRADLCRAHRVSPTFDAQVLSDIPNHSMDQPVNIIVTPQKLLRFR